MKSIIPVLLLISLVAAIASCTKSDNASPSLQLVGNWSLVNDSTYSTGIGPYGPPWSTNYFGKAGDGYNFTSNGKLYIKDAGNTDTATYTLTSGNKIAVQYLYMNGQDVTANDYHTEFNLVSLTNTTATLTNAVFTPGGAFFKTINLKK